MDEDSSKKEMVCSILKILDKHGHTYNETLTTLGKESGLFFNVVHFKDLITTGDYDGAEDYMACFAKATDNQNSREIYLVIRKLKYLKNLSSGNLKKALTILKGELKELMCDDEYKIYEGFQSIHEHLLDHDELMRLIEANPLIRDKLDLAMISNTPSKKLNTTRVNRVKRKITIIDHRSVSLPLVLDEDKASTEHMEPSSKIVGLTYMYSGDAILALAETGKYKLWRWQAAAKATTSKRPALSEFDGIVMLMNLNEFEMKSNEEIVPYFSLSNDDSFVIVSVGRRIIMSDTDKFETKTSFEICLPAEASCIALNPQDSNTAAAGLEDSTICIYDIHSDRSSALLKNTLKGHQGRVTGLAFSSVLNVLVSSGADAQLCVWTLDKWEKKESKF